MNVYRENEYFVNGNLGHFGQHEHCSLRKLEDSEGGEIPVHPGDLGGPQPLLSGAGQRFNFDIRELSAIEVVLDSFHHTLCSVKSESDRLDFWWGLSFSRDRWRTESGEFENDPRSMDDLPLFVMARLFVPNVGIGFGFLDVFLDV